MAIDDILGILPPPGAPSEIPENGWQAIERRLGTILPTDYKLFIERYGSGRIDGFLWIFNPFSGNRNINLIDQLAVHNQKFEYLNRGFQQTCRYAIYPQPAGLLPFGGTDNGDTLYWATNESPDKWWVIVSDARSPLFEEHKCEAIEFLYRALTRRIASAVLPANFAMEPHDFRPLSDLLASDLMRH